MRTPDPDLTPPGSQFSPFSSCRWYTIPPPQWYTLSRRPCILAWRWISFSLEGVRGAADRPALGHRRPLSSLGRRTLFRTEPAQLPGTTKPASGKDGPTVRREVLKEQQGIYVGIDVAKAQVDVAVRPGGDRREVSNDPAGIAALVAQMQQLNPAAPGAGGYGWVGTALGGSPGSCLPAGGGSQPSPGAGLCQGHRAAGQDPIPWMRRSWLTSPKRSGLPCALCGMPRPRPSTHWLLEGTR